MTHTISSKRGWIKEVWSVLLSKHPVQQAHIALFGGMVGTRGFEFRRLLNFILERNDLVADRSPMAGRGTL